MSNATMSDVWQKAEVVMISSDVLTVVTKIGDIGYGVIGDVAKLNILQGEIVEITLTDDPPKQVKDVRGVPETSAESAGLLQAATAA